MTFEELAKRTGFSLRTLFRWKKDGILPDKLKELGIEDNVEETVSKKGSDEKRSKLSVADRIILKNNDFIAKKTLVVEQMLREIAEAKRVNEVLRKEFCNYIVEKPLDGPIGSVAAGRCSVGVAVTNNPDVKKLGDWVHDAIRLPDYKFQEAMKIDNSAVSNMVPIESVKIIPQPMPMESLAAEAAGTLVETQKEELVQENWVEELAKAVKKALPLYYEQQEPAEDPAAEQPNQETVDRLTKSLLTTEQEDVGKVLSPLSKDAEAVYEAMMRGETEKAEIEPITSIRVEMVPVKMPDTKPDDGYELFPKKEYDFYKKIFTAETKQEFLRIKAGEYVTQHEIMPDGFVNRAQLEQFRQKKADSFDFKRFMKQDVSAQVRYAFHVSREYLRMLNYRLETEAGEMFEGTDWDKAFSKFIQNMGEWQRLIAAYYRRFVVDKFFPMNRDVVTGEIVGIDALVHIPKEKMEEWENLRLKWLDYLPKDLRIISFYDTPEYILGSNPDAWINPETLKLEIRTPKKEGVEIKALPWEEKVRYLTDKDLRYAEEHFFSEMTKTADFDKKEECRIKCFIARSERRARMAKHK